MLKVAQRGPRLDSQLVDERPAGVLVDVERVGLASGPVQREHELPSEALSKRLAPNERLELGHELCMAAERELSVNRVREGAEP